MNNNNKAFIFTLLLGISFSPLNAAEQSIPTQVHQRGNDLATNNRRRFAVTIDALRKFSQEITLHSLSNGIPVIIANDSSAPVVSIQVWIGTGAIHEQQHLGAGISHAIEHMVFKGTATRPTGAIAREIRQCGGAINAYTAFDRTVFYTDLPAEEWQTGLDILSDAVFRASFPAEEWEKERNVILREMAMHQDNPERALGYELWHTAFRIHPYRYPVIGYPAIFEKLTVNDLKTFAHNNYVPDNLLISIAGDIPVATVIAALEKQFGKEPRRTRQLAAIPSEPRQIAPREKVEFKTANSLGRLAKAFHTVSITHPDAVALDVLAEVTGGGKAAYLYKHIVEKGLAHQISAWSYTPGQPGLFGISASFDPENMSALRTALQNEISTWHNSGFSSNDVERAKARLLAAELRGRQTAHGQAAQLAQSLFFAGTHLYSDSYLQKLAEITPQDINRVLKLYLLVDNSTTIWHIPDEDTDQTEKDIPSSQPAHELYSLSLSNGIPISVRNNGRLPLVHLCIALGGGVLAENDRIAGISRLTAETMIRGSQNYSSSEIARITEECGASLNAFSGMNSFGIQAVCFSSDLPQIIPIMIECLTKPAFDEKEIELQKARQTADILRENEKPLQRARNELYRMLFPAHPYRRTVYGTPETVNALNASDSRAFLRNTLLAGNVTVAATGDVNGDELIQRLAPALEMIPPGSILPQTAADLPPPSKQANQLKGPYQQAVCLLGMRTGSMHNPHNDALEMLEKFLSGMSSPLFTDIREKQGLAYFTGAWYQSGPDAGAFVLYAGTKPDSIKYVEKALRQNLEQIARQGIPDKDFTATLNSIRGDHNRSLQNGKALAMKMALYTLYGFDAEYVIEKTDRFSRLNNQDLQNAAKWILNNYTAFSTVIPE